VPADVVVVDNSCTDETITRVRLAEPYVRRIRSEQNLGFAGGANLGIGATTTPYVAVLNNDATVAPNGWPDCWPLPAKPGTGRVGAVTSRVQLAGGAGCRRASGVVSQALIAGSRAAT
jgi:glycosyltransferase involved in cell wall biosynthesis